MTETIAETRLACACGTTRKEREDPELELFSQSAPVFAYLVIPADHARCPANRAPPVTSTRCDLRMCRGCGALYAWGRE